MRRVVLREDMQASHGMKGNMMLVAAHAWPGYPVLHIQGIYGVIRMYKERASGGPDRASELTHERRQSRG